MPDWQILLSAFVCTVNVLGGILIIADKNKAQKNQRRIRELYFFLLALLGACPGIYGCMQMIRHKTRHKRFMLGLPIIFLLQIVAIIFCLIYS